MKCFDKFQSQDYPHQSSFIRETETITRIAIYLNIVPVYVRKIQLFSATHEKSNGLSRKKRYRSARFECWKFDKKPREYSSFRAKRQGRSRIVNENYFVRFGRRCGETANRSYFTISFPYFR